jgi:hypothetical protein
MKTLPTTASTGPLFVPPEKTLGQNGKATHKQTPQQVVVFMPALDSSKNFLPTDTINDFYRKAQMIQDGADCEDRPLGIVAQRNADRLFSRTDILSRPCPIPNAPGIYAWYFRGLDSVTSTSCLKGGWFSSALFRALVLWEHLLEGFHEVRIRLFHRITGAATIKLPAPMPSYPLAIRSFVHRSEYGTVFGDMDRLKPPPGL